MGYLLADPGSAPITLPLAAAGSCACLLLTRKSARDRTRERLHEELLLNERRYRSLIEATAAIVWRTGALGELDTPQPEWSAFTGQSFEEMAGKGWISAIHPEDRARVLLEWSAALDRQSAFDSVFRLRDASGLYRDVMTRAVPVTDAGGRVIEWIGANIDITEQRRAQHVHAETDRQLNRVLDSLYTFVCILAPDGTVINSNSAPLKAAGIASEETVGKPYWDCYWWNWSARAQELIRSAIGRACEGETVRQDVEMRVAGGALLAVDFMVAPMRTGDGTVTNLVASGVDVSDRRKTELMLSEREQFYRQLIESMPLLSWTCLPDGTFDYVSARWQKYGGHLMDPASVFGSLQGVHPDDRESFVRTWREGMHGEHSFQAEVRLRRDDGVYRWFACFATPIRSPRGQVLRWCGTSIDIDDRKQMEEALRESETRLRTLNSTLERRVKDRTREVVERSDQLRALALDLSETESRERRRLAQILHDHFQQLVSAAKLKAGLLRRKIGSDTAAVQSLRDVEGLLEEAITASRTVATELSPPVLHDGGLVPALQWLVRRMEMDHQLHIDFRVEADCEPDNEQVRVIVFECVREILFNVRKHAGVDDAKLTLTLLPEGLLLARVSDEGKGFSPITLERRKATDTSFGLFSIRERMSLIGGLLKIDSEPGKGTRVELSVPCVPRSRKEPGLVASPVAVPVTIATAGSRLRVLVADDHALFREGLVALLSQEAYLEVIGQAGDGEEAVRMARQLRPDLMIVDVSMPKLNGVQVTAMVSKELPGTRVVGLSMHEHADMAKSMRDAGAIAYFAKSGAPEETLLTLLRSISSEMPSAAS